jgi:diguanylate cyclase (GGDEF)-like protein/PAS domain S-box-containing protein
MDPAHETEPSGTNRPADGQRLEVLPGGLLPLSARDLERPAAVADELRAAELRFQTLVEQLPLVVYIDAAAEGSPNLYTSPQTTALLGYTPEEWRDDPSLLEKILHPDDRDRVLAEVGLDLRRDQTVRSEYRLIARDGRTVWIRDESTAVCDEDGVPRQWQGYLLDITAEREALGELERLAFSDPLTELPNRARLEQVMHEWHGRGELLTLLFLDLDDFKTVNDSLGHGAGDELLCVVAKRLKNIVREDDLVARIGGDEFALLVGNCDAAAVAQRVVSTLASPVKAAGYELAIGASIGLAVGSTPDEILRHADMAMYDAKGAGGGTYRFFEQSMHDAAVNRLELLADLSRPSLAEELFLEYQPLYEIETGRLVGAEALARWHHPRRGLIQPLDFIPLAEETGRIVELGRIVLAEAARQTVAWRREHDEHVRISVNVAAQQLANHGFAQDVAATLASAGLDPDALVLELTESALMTPDEVSMQNLRTLRELGICVAIDDFGTGYSSLAYLARLSIDSIKIARSFIDECDRSDEGARMVETITTLGHALGLTVVAEGIERDAQLAALRAAGCNLGQGFLLAKPLPADELAKRL